MKIKNFAFLYVLALSLTLQACGGGAGIVSEPGTSDAAADSAADAAADSAADNAADNAGDTADDAADATDAADDSSDNGSAVSTVSVFDEGVVGTAWDNGINAFDSAIGWAECNEDGGEGCPSIGWAVVADSERGDVLQITHTADGDPAGLYIGSSEAQDVSAFAGGSVVFDINVVSGDSKITMKIDCIYPCSSGDQDLGSKGGSGWETVTVAVDTLVTGGLDLTSVNTGFVIWATDATSTVFEIDNVRWEATGSGDGGSTDGGSTDGDAEVSDVIDMTGSFGGAGLAGSSYSLPAGSQEWGGFANLNTDVYPFAFVDSGSITFMAAIPEGGTATNIYFRFENEPYSEANPSIVDPSYDTPDELITSEELTEYTIVIPAQDAANTYSSFLMYVVENDSPVTIKDIVVTHDGGSTGLPEETAYEAPTSLGIEILNEATVTSEWGGNDSLSIQGCAESCNEITQETVVDDQRGDVLQISYSDNAGHAVLAIQNIDPTVDVTAFTELSFDIKILNIDADVGFNLLVQATDGAHPPIDITPADSAFWQTFTVPLTAMPDLDFTAVTGPFVFFPDFGKGAGLVYQLDDIRWQ